MECPERIRDLGTRVTVQRFETGEVGKERETLRRNRGRKEWDAFYVSLESW